MKSDDNVNILIVDDLPHWRKLLSNVLSDYKINTASTYSDAIEIIDNLNIDIAILDIRLKDKDVWNVDGIDLLKRLKEMRPDVRVVILTGYRESVRARIFRDYKPDAIIDKEFFNNNNFRNTIQKLLEDAISY